MNQIKRLLIIILAACTFWGCSSMGIQNFNVEGIMPLPQVHINSVKEDSQKIHFSGSITPCLEKQRTGNTSPGHTKVNNMGVFEGDIISYQKDDNGRDVTTMEEHSGANIYPFTGKNYQWQFPKSSIDLGLEFPITNQSYGTIKLNLSLCNNQTNWGFGAGYAGESLYENYGIRSEAGLSFYQLCINATYWDHYSHYISIQPGEYIYIDGYNFTTENEKRFRTGIYTAFTIFTTNNEKKLNYFIQCGIHWQRLSSFEAGSIFHAIDKIVALPSSIIYLSLTPGIYFNISEHTIFFCGIRLIKEPDIDNSNGFFTILPYFTFCID